MLFLNLLDIYSGFNTVRFMSTQPSSDPKKSALAARQAFFKQVNALNVENPHLLAKRLKDSGEPLTLEVFNSLLSEDQQVTPEVFEYFQSLSLDSITLECGLPLSKDDRMKLNAAVGSTESSSKIQEKGIYVFRDQVNNQVLYIGSSKHLGARGPQYLVPSRQKRFTGLWGKYIRSNPTLIGVKLGFIILPHSISNYFLALEQYFHLQYTSLYNVLLLATPSGPVNYTPEQLTALRASSGGRKINVYLEDRTTLVHSFDSVRDAAKQLGSLNHNSIHKGMSKDRPVKDLFFTTEFLVNTIVDLRPIEELQSIVANAVVVSGRKPSKVF